MRIGRVLAEDLAARRTQPPFAVSAMDGYAVRAEDLGAIPVELRIVAEIPAGAGFGGHVGNGEAARIFTGAPMPAGADTIVIQEDTERDGDRVRVLEGAARGRYVRRAGLDFTEGDVLLQAGRRLTARDIGLAAAMNRPWLFVHRRPRVGILSTGDEIVMPGDPIGPHQIVSSNSLALAAFVAACGGMPVSVGNAPDDPAALRRFAAATRGVDLLVTTGGASVGEHDLVRDVLGGRRAGARFLADRDAARKAADGRQLPRYADGRAAGQPGLDLGLRAAVSEACARPAERRRVRGGSGADSAAWHSIAKERPAAGLFAIEARPGRGRHARSVPVRRAGQLDDAASSAADCLVIRPPHAPAIAAGATVPIVPFPGGALPI